MASAFNLTAQLNIVGPNNLRPVISNIRRQLQGLNTNINIGLDARTSRNIRNVTSDLTRLNSVLSQTAANAQQVSANLNTISATFTNIQRAANNTTNGLNNINNATNNLNRNLPQATNQIEAFGRQSALAVRRFAAFASVTSVIYALTRSISSAFSEFVKFDKEVIRLVQVTGQSKETLKGLTDEISRLSVSFGVSSSELINVSTTLAQAGLTANQTRAALEALAKASLAPSFDDLTRTVEGSIAAMRQFGISANELESALGSVNAVAAAFAVEAGDIITAIQRTGGVFATASKGVSQGTDALNEFIAVFTSVRATTRESAETIATGLRTIFTRLQRGSTITFLKEIGINLTDLEGKFVGPYRAIQLLSEGLRRLDPRDLRFSEIVEELGGFRQIGKVIPLIQQFATSQQALKVAQSGTASLAKNAAEAQLSLANQFAKVREQFLAFVRSIGESKTFRTLTSLALGLASSLISVANAFKPILPYLAILGTIRGTQAALSFGRGFLGGGGAGGTGGGAGGGGTTPNAPTGTGRQGSSSSNAVTNATVTANTTAITNNINSLNSNTTTINSLTTAVDNMRNAFVNGVNALGRLFSTRGGLSNGGRVYGFADGGLVPGIGSGDSVRSMLEPGEFVLNKRASKAIGTNRLNKINRYAKGGSITLEALSKERDSETIKKAYNNKIQPLDEIIGTLNRKKIQFDDSNINWELLVRETDKRYKKYITDKKTNKDSFQLLNQASSEAFEIFIQKLIGEGEITPNSYPVDILRKNKNPIEVKFTKKDVSDAHLLSKLFRHRHAQKSINRYKFTENIDKNPPVDIGALDVYEMGQGEKQKYNNWYAQNKDRILNYKAGSPDGVKPKKINRAKKNLRTGARGPRGFQPLEEKEYALFAEQAYRDAGEFGGPNWDMRAKPPMPKVLSSYTDKLLQYVFRSGGSGIEVTKPMAFSDKVDPKTIAMLEEMGDVIYGTGIGELGKGVAGYVGTEVMKFGKMKSKKATSGRSQKRMDPRTFTNFAKLLAGGKDVKIPKDVAESLGAMRAPQEQLEKTVGQYADFVAAEEQRWTDISVGSVLDKYLESTLKEPMLSDYRTSKSGQELAKPFWKTRLRKAVNEALDEYEPLNSGGVARFAGGGRPFEKGGLVDLYHGSNTGIDDSVLKSFKEKGALSSIAQGYGQGAGFYVYTEKNRAIQQAKMRVGGGSFGTRVAGDTSGKPMVLTFSEMLSPKNYDLDYELQKGLVTQWLYNNYDKIKHLVAPETDSIGIIDIVPKDRDRGRMSNAIKVQTTQGSRDIYTGTAGDLEEGAIISQLMQKLRSGDPKIVNEFESKLFEKPLGLVLKYVGTPPLIPKDIETFADGGTVPALVSNGEAYVPPKIAQRIGYGTLNKMNQADRNGMGRFSEGGISVFRGPGTGTSDSIPTNLPVGSFVLREKATKALGFNSGGFVQKFANGSVGGLGYPGSMPFTSSSAQQAQSNLNSQVQNTSKSFSLLSNISPKLANSFRTINETLGGTLSTLSLAATTLSTQLPQLYATIDRFTGSNLLQSTTAAGFAGAIQQGSANVFAAKNVSQQAGFGALGTSVTVLGSAIGGAISGYLKSREQKSLDNLTKQLQQSDKRIENTLSRLENESLSGEQRGQLTDQLYQELAAQYESLGRPLENAVEDSSSKLARFADSISGILLTFASLKIATRRSKGGIVYASKGTLVNYEPKGTDTIPAMLSKGEFVVNARSTRKNLGLLNAINKNRGGIINPTYLANGGPSFLEDYMRNLSYFYNPYSTATSEADNDLLGQGLKYGGRTAMAIGAIAASGAAALGGGLTAIGGGALSLGRSAIGGGLSLGRSAIGGISSAARGRRGRGRLLDLGLLAASAGTQAYNFFTGGGPSVVQQQKNQERAEKFRTLLSRTVESQPANVEEILSRQRQAATFKEGSKAQIDFLSGENSPLVKTVAKLALANKNLDPEKLDEYLKVASEARTIPENQRTQQQKEAIKAQEEIEKARTDLYIDAFNATSTLDQEQKDTKLNIVAAVQKELDAGKELSDVNEEQAKVYNEVIGLGKEAVAAQSRNIDASLLLKSSYNAAAVAAKNFVDSINNIASGLDRANVEVDKYLRQLDINVGSRLTGRAQFAPIDRSNENLFNNLRAYSREEIQNITSGLSRAFGLDRIRTGTRVTETGQIVDRNVSDILSDASLAIRTLEVELPRILGQAGGIESSGDITEPIIRALTIGGLNRESAREIARQINNNLTARRNAGGKGAQSFEDIAQDVPGFLQSLDALKKANELQSKIAKALNDNLEKFDTRLQAASDALVKAAEINAEAARIGADFQTSLNQALGRPSSLNQMNAGINAEIRALSTVIDENGRVLAQETMDPNILAQRINSGNQIIAQENERRDRAVLAGNQAEITRFGQAITRQTQVVNQSQKALEKLAQDTTRASNALSKIQERKNILDARRGGFLEIIANASNPDFLMGVMQRRAAVDRVRAGNASMEDLEIVAQNFDTIIGQLDAESQQAFIDQFTRLILRIPDLDPRTRRDIAASFNPQNDPVVRTMTIAAQEYTRIQLQALQQLNQQQKDAAKILIDGIPDAAKTFREIVVKAATEAAEQLKIVDAQNRFAGQGTITDTKLLQNIISPRNLSGLLTGGAASFNFVGLRKMLPQMNLTNDNLKQLINSGALISSEQNVNFAEMVRGGDFAGIRKAITASEFNIDAAAFNDLFASGAMTFNREAIKGLTEAGALTVTLEGLSKLARLPDDIAGSLRFMLQNMINQYTDFQVNNPVNKQNGGLIYASQGQFINFQPRGTDTVPAMLTPGEFVVNAKSTARNLPLLQAINNGTKGYSKGGMVYLADGGMAAESPLELFDRTQQREMDQAGRFEVGNPNNIPNQIPVGPVTLTRQEILAQRRAAYQQEMQRRRDAYQSRRSSNMSEGRQRRQNVREQAKQDRMEAMQKGIDEYLANNDVVADTSLPFNTIEAEKHYRYKLADGSWSPPTTASLAYFAAKKIKEQQAEEKRLAEKYRPITIDNILDPTDPTAEELAKYRQLETGERLAREAQWSVTDENGKLRDYSDHRGFLKPLTAEQMDALYAYQQRERDKERGRQNARTQIEQQQRINQASEELARGFEEVRVNTAAKVDAEIQAKTETDARKKDEAEQRRQAAIAKFDSVPENANGWKLSRIISTYGTPDEQDLFIRERLALSPNDIDLLDEATLQQIISRHVTAQQQASERATIAFDRLQQQYEQTQLDKEVAEQEAKTRAAAEAALKYGITADPLTNTVTGIDEKAAREALTNPRTGLPGWREGDIRNKSREEIQHIVDAIDLARSVATIEKQQRLQDTDSRYEELRAKGDKLRGSEALEYARLARERGVDWNKIPGASYRTDQIIREEAAASQLAAMAGISTGEKFSEEDFLGMSRAVRIGTDVKELEDYKQREVTSITAGGMLVHTSMMLGDMLGGGDGNNISDEMVLNAGSIGGVTPGFATMFDLALDATNFAPGLPPGAGRAAKGLSKAAQATRRSRTGVGALLRDTARLDRATMTRQYRIERSQLRAGIAARRRGLQLEAGIDLEERWASQWENQKAMEFLEVGQSNTPIPTPSPTITPAVAPTPDKPRPLLDLVGGAEEFNTPSIVAAAKAEEAAVAAQRGRKVTYYIDPMEAYPNTVGRNDLTAEATRRRMSGTTARENAVMGSVARNQPATASQIGSRRRIKQLAMSEYGPNLKAVSEAGNVHFDEFGQNPYGLTGWKGRLTPKDDTTVMAIKEWLDTRGKELGIAQYKASEGGVFTFYSKSGSVQETGAIAQAAEKELKDKIQLGLYGEGDTFIPGTNISGRFDARALKFDQASSLIEAQLEGGTFAEGYRRAVKEGKAMVGVSRGGNAGVGGVHDSNYVDYLKRLRLKYDPSALPGVRGTPDPAKLARIQEEIDRAAQVGDEWFKQNFPNFYSRGGIVYASNGMMIPYSPRGSDTVPAMLTPGEFVINRRSAQKHMGLLQSINNNPNQYFNKGGVVQYLEGGGSVGNNSSAMGIDFTQFVNAVDNFGTYVSSIQTSFGQIQNIDFGVFKQSVDLLVSSFGALNGPANLFNNAAIAFGNNISQITSAITALANIPDTISINGRIDMPSNITITLEGNTSNIGLELKRDILDAVANALSQNNPGINVDKLREQP